jgi:heme a synthase
LTSPTRAEHRSASFDAWRHRWGLLTVGATLALIFVGGLVTSTGSGLAVPDWPLSYGMLMPPMVGGVFYEHGHRMVASAVGLLTLVLAVWTARRESRRGVRRLAWAALLAVVLQGVLGGLTVIYLLPTPISVAHACLAQTFFCLTILLAYATSREWLSPPPPGPREDDRGVRAAAVVVTTVVYVQLAVGAVMRHIGAGLAIPDFPLAFGQLVPPLGSTAVAVHFLHRVGALAVLAAAVVLRVRARASSDRSLARGATLLVGLVLAQIALGGAAVLTVRAVLPTTLHVTLGAAVLGTAWFLLLRAWRRLPAERRRRAAAPSALPEAVRS